MVLHGSLCGRVGRCRNSSPHNSFSAHRSRCFPVSPPLSDTELLYNPFSWPRLIPYVQSEHRCCAIGPIPGRDDRNGLFYTGSWRLPARFRFGAILDRLACDSQVIVESLISSSIAECWLATCRWPRPVVSCRHSTPRVGLPATDASASPGSASSTTWSQRSTPRANETLYSLLVGINYDRVLEDRSLVCELDPQASPHVAECTLS